MIHYITISDMSNDIRINFDKIPKNIGGVITIPRSGTIPGSMIAEHLNVGLCNIDMFVEKTLQGKQSQQIYRS